MIQIYHNSRCSKSRECLAFLTESNAEFEVVNYLQQIPTADEIKVLLAKLNIKAIDLIRRDEKVWKEKYADKQLTESQIIHAMSENPILIQRPIIVNGEHAVIARPKEKAAKLF